MTRRILLGFIALTAVIGVRADAAVTISNATTSVTVYGGEANNGLEPAGGYFSYTDSASGEETTWSIDPLLRYANGTTTVLSNGNAGGFASPTPLLGGAISSAVTPTIAVSAFTELVGSNARTTFVFDSVVTPNGPVAMDGTSFVFYAENDIFAADDTATFAGSIAGGNLALYQYDTTLGSLTVKLTGESVTGATLSLFGAGLWPDWGNALEGGDLSVLSADGSNFATAGDLGLALAFNLTGSHAVVVVNYDTQPVPPDGGEVPEPASMLIWGLGAFGCSMGAYRRRKMV